MIEKIRNIAIIAHVDHGKTTLVDQLLRQSGSLTDKQLGHERIMDSDAQEQERGITILAKNTAIQWRDYRINIVDTPGHADFGGEVERALSMVDGVLLLVDSVEGPMPQTRFVTQKAFKRGLNPIVVVNKMDRPSARPDWVLTQMFDLFDRLGATDEQLDFPIVYASAMQGKSSLDSNNVEGDLTALFETIVKSVPAPKVSVDGPFQMQVSALDYSNYMGLMGIGRIARGRIVTPQPVTVISADGSRQNARIQQVQGYQALQRVVVESAEAGDIVCISGIENLKISDTICDPKTVEALPPLLVDEPTVTMTFQVNNSPFAGKEGKYLTSRHIQERLQKELKHNVALRVEQGNDPDKFQVSGRGEMHLAVLIENMRREGYELGVSRPEVICKMIDGVEHEPYEQLAVDIEEFAQGSIMEQLGLRRAELKDMIPDGKGRVRMDFVVPSRGLIGFRQLFLTLTSGTGILTHSFSHYDVKQSGDVAKRQNGVLISNGQGKVLGFALFNLQERGRMMVEPGVQVYEGMIIGQHSRSNDLVVNPLKGKQLTNMRASGTDENIVLTPAIKMSLEQALEYIEDDELVEVTPESIRVRKKLLTENDRKRHGR